MIVSGQIWAPRSPLATPGASENSDVWVIKTAAPDSASTARAEATRGPSLVPLVPKSAETNKTRTETTASRREK